MASYEHIYNDTDEAVDVFWMRDKSESQPYKLLPQESTANWFPLNQEHDLCVKNRCEADQLGSPICIKDGTPSCKKIVSPAMNGEGYVYQVSGFFERSMDDEIASDNLPIVNGISYNQEALSNIALQLLGQLGNHDKYFLPGLVALVSSTFVLTGLAKFCRLGKSLPRSQEPLMQS